MTHPHDFTAVAVSVEPSARRYLARRAGVALAGVALVAGATTTALAQPFDDRPTIGATGAATASDGSANDGGADGDDGIAGPSTIITAATASDPAGPGAATEDASPDANGEDAYGVEEAALPDRASRFVAQPPDRVLDTRAGDTDSPPEPDTAFAVAVEPGRTAVALSVTVMGTQREGAVLVDGRAGVVEAITIGKAGATTTNLVIVPVVGDELSIRTTAGGHLVVDVVGTFEAATSATSGRFVAVDPARVTRLETETDGRQAEIVFNEPTQFPSVGALLVVVTADVGTDGGRVSLGPDPDAFDQMLMWAPAAADNRERRGLAIIEAPDDGLADLRYEGGALLTVDVIGYFTDDTAVEATDGLFVPSGPRQLFSGQLDASEAFTVDQLGERAATALLTIGSRSAVPGQLGSTLVSVDAGSLSFTTSEPLEAEVTLLGTFTS